MPGWVTRCSPSLPSGGDDVHDPGRKPGVGETLGQHVGVERRLGGGLDDAGAAHQQGGSDLEEGEDQRRIPRHDRRRPPRPAPAGRARRPSSQYVPPRRRRCQRGRRSSRPPSPPPRAWPIMENWIGRPVLPRDQLSEFHEPGFDVLRQRSENLGPFRRFHAGPRPGVEGGPRRPDGGVDVGGCAVRNAADELLGAGRYDFDAPRSRLGDTQSPPMKSLSLTNIVTSVPTRWCRVSRPGGRSVRGRRSSSAGRSNGRRRCRWRSAFRCGSRRCGRPRRRRGGRRRSG